MLTTTKTPADLRLLEAADLAEEQHGKSKYDQTTYGDVSCKTPACLLGGYAWRHPESAAFAYLRCFNPDKIIAAYEAVAKEFDVNENEFTMLFSATGCDRAYQDGAKAAAFVRRFVEERALARLKK
jgi:hypothetical protein